MPDDPTSEKFQIAYADCLAGRVKARQRYEGAQPGTLAALIASYKSSATYLGLRGTTKRSYSTPLEILSGEHGHRTVSGMTKEGIEAKILGPYLDRPGQRLSILKILRILVSHGKAHGWLSRDPSAGIKRPKVNEIRSWTDQELSKFEARWPLGSKQRTAFALMLNLGAARTDAHQITWRQFEDGSFFYSRSKTGVAVAANVSAELRRALDAAPRNHVTIINTEYGKPFTAKGFGNFMRSAIQEAGLPLDCKPHGLRKTLGRILAEAGATPHEIMAMLGHTTLAEAERYTRDASRKLNANNAIRILNRARSTNGNAQTPDASLGKSEKAKG